MPSDYGYVPRAPRVPHEVVGLTASGANEVQAARQLKDMAARCSSPQAPRPGLSTAIVRLHELTNAIESKTDMLMNHFSISEPETKSQLDEPSPGGPLGGVEWCTSRLNEVYIRLERLENHLIS